MKLLRTAALFTAAAFSLPLASGFNNQRNNVQAVKPNEIKPIDPNIKKAIDEKRIALEKKEREFASELGGWAGSELTNVLPFLYMVSDNKNETLKARKIAFKTVKLSDEFIKLTGNDFSIKKPNEKQVEAFNKLITSAQEGGDIIILLSVNKFTPFGFAKKIEGSLKKTNPELKGEKLKKEVEHYSKYFIENKKTFEKLQWDYIRLRVELGDFNEEAKKAKEPDYQPVWGMNEKKLAELLRTFALRK